jgi:hypothetical protein
MEKVEFAALEKAMRLLDATGCKYRICTPGGSWFGDLNLAKPKRKFKYPKGEKVTYLRQHLDSIQVGDVVKVPSDKYDIGDLQKSISSYLSKTLGPKSHTTAMNRDANCVEVLRVA